MKVFKQILTASALGLVCHSSFALPLKGDPRTLTDSTIAREKYLYQGLTQLIYQIHYAPKPENDSLSAAIFENTLQKVDPNKDVFLQSDIDTLSAFKTLIDNEMQGQNPLGFYFALRQIYLNRIAQLSNLEILKDAKKWKPIKKDVEIKSYKDAKWATTDKERMDRWNENLTYQYMTKMLDTKKVFKKEGQRSDEAKKALFKKYKHWLEKNSTGFDESQFYSSFINVFYDLMDPHTEYQPPVDRTKFDQMMSNSFFGIGVQLGYNEQNDILIKKVMSGLSAWKSGKISDGSILLAIGQNKSGDWESTDGLDIPEIADRVRGKEDSFVRIKIKDGKTGEIREVLLQRTKINLEQAAARSAIIQRKDGKRIGVIYLPEFYNDFANPEGAKSADDVKAELQRLDSAHVDALLFDLRNNGGGSLLDVVKIGGYFIPSGPIVQVKNKEGKVLPLNDEDPSVLYNGPMAIMVNAQSASASEIFAAAMQDYNRALIIGTNSYGKGTVQRQFPLGKAENGESEYGAAKITFEKFYRINGRTTQKAGITPDIYIPDIYNYYKFREKDHASALGTDTIAPAQYSAYPAGTDNVRTKAKLYDYHADKQFVQLDSVAHILAQTPLLWTNYDKINKQYNTNKSLVKMVTDDTKLPKDQKLQVIEIGNFQSKDWYKEWIDQLSTSDYYKQLSQIILP